MPPKTTTQEQLDRIENAILGNGREGLLARTARIEEKLEATIKLAEETKDESGATIIRIEESIEKVTGLVNELTSSVKSHHETIHLSNLLKKKEFWVIVFVGYIALHMISTYVPSLWNLIAASLGLTKLTILIP